MGYYCVFDDCEQPGKGPRNMCGRHQTRVARGVDAAPAGAGAAPSTEWMADAECRYYDPELFFPVGTTGPAVAQIAEAKTVCRRCPVMSECLTWALATAQDHGVFGGASEEERRALKTNTRRMVTAGGAR